MTKPVNAIARPDLTLAEIFDAGAQRVSVGGALAYGAMSAMADVARAVLEQGELAGLRVTAPIRDWLAD